MISFRGESLTILRKTGWWENGGVSFWYYLGFGTAVDGRGGEVGELTLQRVKMER